MSLSKGEEQLMKHLWELGRCYLKELLAALPEPKPATTTVATLLKRMSQKGFVGYELHGNSRQYFPLVTKEAYFGRHLRSLMDDFFGSSPAALASLFTGGTKLTKAELEELQRIIDQQISEQE